MRPGDGDTWLAHALFPEPRALRLFRPGSQAGRLICKCIPCFLCLSE
ncbi:hypothetical protein EES40_25970 [Streptomyces sp. ADI93-02]|nr:hypothetical protein EES40_25970 [Streptomyces sp. ADI93-02]